MEKDREEIHQDKDGKPNGTGSWYKQVPGDYSTQEYLAPQGHKDRVCTRNLKEQARIQRRNEQDNLDLESDWQDRTSIDPERWYQMNDAKLVLHKSQMTKRKLQEIRKDPHNLLPPCKKK